jgi:tetratricopeptide (TPR) repeat protein
MDKVTFLNGNVIEFIDKSLIPLRFVAPESPAVVKDFNLKRTPMWLILDSEGTEHHQTVGFFSPEALIPSLMLGMAKAHFDQGGYEEALQALENLLARYPEDDSIPEAIYLRGGARFKSTRDRSHLRELYEQLWVQYPLSPWTKRAYGRV